MHGTWGKSHGDVKGEFLLKEVSDREAKIKFNFGETREAVTSDVTIKMETMEGEAEQGYDSEGINIASVEHFSESAQLMYFIPNADALFIKHGKDKDKEKSAYIQAKLTMPTPEPESAGAGYVVNIENADEEWWFLIQVFHLEEGIAP